MKLRIFNILILAIACLCMSSCHKYDDFVTMEDVEANPLTIYHDARFQSHGVFSYKYTDEVDGQTYRKDYPIYMLVMNCKVEGYVKRNNYMRMTIQTSPDKLYKIGDTMIDQETCWEVHPDMYSTFDRNTQSGKYDPETYFLEGRTYYYQFFVIGKEGIMWVSPIYSISTPAITNE